MISPPSRLLRVLPLSEEPASVQLAAGPAMLHGLEHTGAAAIRWYQIWPHALILGSSQRPEEVNLEVCHAEQVGVYRRRSGGGAVLTDGLLSVDLALPHADPLFRHDVTESYRWYGELWAAVLEGFGITGHVVSIAEAREDTRLLSRLLKRVCYGGLSPYEVVVDGRKVVGLAQVRRRSGLLLQAGVYLDWSAEHTAQLVATTPEEEHSLTPQLAQRVAGLSELATVPVQPLVAAVQAALERIGFHLTADEWRADEAAERQRGAVGEYAHLAL